MCELHKVATTCVIPTVQTEVWLCTGKHIWVWQGINKLSFLNVHFPFKWCLWQLSFQFLKKIESWCILYLHRNSTDSGNVWDKCSHLCLVFIPTVKGKTIRIQAIRREHSIMLCVSCYLCLCLSVSPPLSLICPSLMSVSPSACLSLRLSFRKMFLVIWF